jgi:Tol biopolymer transport system component
LSLVLVSPLNGSTVTRVPSVGPSNGVRNIYGWSPNGHRIAILYGRCVCRIGVVDLGTGHVRRLLGGADSSTYVAWSPDSRRLLVTTGCLLRRVSAGGGKPRRLRSCP